MVAGCGAGGGGGGLRHPGGVRGIIGRRLVQLHHVEADHLDDRVASPTGGLARPRRCPVGVARAPGRLRLWHRPAPLRPPLRRVGTRGGGVLRVDIRRPAVDRLRAPARTAPGAALWRPQLRRVFERRWRPRRRRHAHARRDCHRAGVGHPHRSGRGRGRRHTSRGSLLPAGVARLARAGRVVPVGGDLRADPRRRCRSAGAQVRAHLRRASSRAAGRDS